MGEFPEIKFALTDVLGKEELINLPKVSDWDERLSVSSYIVKLFMFILPVVMFRSQEIQKKFCKFLAEQFIVMKSFLFEDKDLMKADSFVFNLFSCQCSLTSNRVTTITPSSSKQETGRNSFPKVKNGIRRFLFFVLNKYLTKCIENDYHIFNMDNKETLQQIQNYQQNKFDFVNVKEEQNHETPNNESLFQKLLERSKKNVDTTKKTKQSKSGTKEEEKKEKKEHQEEQKHEKAEKEEQKQQHHGWPKEQLKEEKAEEEKPKQQEQNKKHEKEIDNKRKREEDTSDEDEIQIIEPPKKKEKNEDFDGILLQILVVIIIIESQNESSIFHF